MKITELELKRLIWAMEDKNLSIEEVIKFIENSRSEAAGLVVTSSVNCEIVLIVDYNKTIKQAIADGRYDQKNGNITAENLPISKEMVGTGTVVYAKLFHFNRHISSDDAISKMDEAGYRPANLMELLTLGILFPESQRQFLIVALGSIWRDSHDDPCVPLLNITKSKRELDLGWFNESWWNANYRFLAIKK